MAQPLYGDYFGKGLPPPTGEEPYAARAFGFSGNMPYVSNLPLPETAAFGAGYPAGDGKKRTASGCACTHEQHSFGCGYTQHVHNARFIDISAPSFGSGPPLPWTPVTKCAKYVAACFCPGVFVCFGVRTY